MGFSGSGGDSRLSPLLAPPPTCGHSGCPESASSICLLQPSPSYFLSLITFVAPPLLLPSAETCGLSMHPPTTYSTPACPFCSQVLFSGQGRWIQMAKQGPSGVSLCLSAPRCRWGPLGLGDDSRGALSGYCGCSFLFFTVWIPLSAPLRPRQS